MLCLMITHAMGDMHNSSRVIKGSLRSPEETGLATLAPLFRDLETRIRFPSPPLGRCRMSLNQSRALPTDYRFCNLEEVKLTLTQHPLTPSTNPAQFHALGHGISSLYRERNNAAIQLQNYRKYLTT